MSPSTRRHARQARTCARKLGLALTEASMIIIWALCLIMLLLPQSWADNAKALRNINKCWKIICKINKNLFK